jgi:nitrite reductase/ring-hydroxylating ferredoxin subunit
VKAGHVIVASQIPVIPEGMYFTKAYPIAHPVAAARHGAADALQGMYLSVDTPSHSIRTALRDGERWLVAAGGRYRTGEENAENRMLADLEAFLRDGFGIAAPDYVWSNEDFQSMDDMPFVGRVSESKALYVATGFGAWGITNGMVAAHVLTDQVLGRQSGEADLFDASRLKPLHGGAAFLTENLKAGAHLVGDKLLKRAVRDLDEISPGEGGVIETEAGQTAVLRKADGTLAAVSAVCTHMGCIVGWNPIDGTWDCPCHGSRFDADGRVLSGPASAPLEPRQVP